MRIKAGSTPKFICKTCGKRAKVTMISAKHCKAECCGRSTEYWKGSRDLFANRDLQGRLHGTQPMIGGATAIYNHGSLEYLDDGNGYVYDKDEEY